MNRRRGQVTVAITLLAFASAVATVGPSLRADAEGSGDAGGIYGGPSPTSDGYVYAYDATTGDKVRVPAKDAGRPEAGVVYKYKVSPDCPQNDEDGQLLCLGATSFCAGAGESGIRNTVWRAERSPILTNYARVGTLCIGGKSSGTSEQEIESEVSEFERLHLPVASPEVQPAKTAIVNIPVLVSVKSVPEQVMQVNEPVPGQLVATPTYTWTFDDGSVVTGAGTPYDGVDPRVHPNHYLSHTYTQRQDEAWVTLSVTWNATFTTAGRTISLPLVTMPPIKKTYTVKELRAVLVAS